MDLLALLDAVADAGYEGIDLGPVGFLGWGDGLRDALAGRGLALAGGYVELPFNDRARLGAAWPELDAVLDALDAVASIQGPNPPRPTLAHAPTPDPRRIPDRPAAIRPSR